MNTSILKSENGLLKNSSSEQIKSYFERVLELSKSDEQFPINMDDVWPLVYSRKDVAVRELIEGGTQGVDYQFFHQKAEQKDLSSRSGEQKRRGGHNKLTYKISVSCMEWLIARKLRPIFEVYRMVFHNSAKQAQIDSAIVFIEGAVRILNLNENSKLQMMQRAADIYGVDRSLLPNYTQSKDVLIPLSKVLAGSGMSARYANPILEAKGVIEKKWRKSSRGMQVYFWNIKPDYLHLGENQVSPSNPRETQPMWYEARSDEIIRIITGETISF